MLADLRLAVRSLSRAPGFTLLVVATLALGIGGNTAVFGVVDAVLLKRLPYDEPQRLVTVWQDVSRMGGPVREWLNYAVYEDVRDEPGLFEAVGVWGGWGPTLTGAGEAEVLTGAAVSWEMFPGVLRVRPALGRAFLPADDVEGAPGVVLLSHDAWRDRFASDPSVLGRAVSLDETPYTVVGVMAEGFRPPFAPDAELWRPLGASGGRGCTRGCYGMRGVARLASGVSLAQARTHADALATRLEETYPDDHTNVGLALFELQEDMTRDASRALWILLGAVGFVLLIACVNVANLLLVRGAGREGELAVRVALGASRGAILRQFLVESMVLSVAGGLAGLAVASWGTDALVALAPDGALQPMNPPGVDGRALLFTAALTLTTGLLFGLFPAWRAGRQEVHEGLRAAGRGAGSGGGRLRSALAVAQIAMALVLLVGAGLLVRSFQRLNDAELGFEPEGVLALSLALPGTRYPDGPARQAYYGALLNRLGSLPGVTSVGAVNSLPMSGNDSDSSFFLEGEPPPGPGVSQAAWVRPVTDGYFETVGMRVVEGRGFTAGDDADAPLVILVNETLARRWFPEGDAVGRRISFGSPENPRWRTIVGVAPDVRHFGIREPVRPAAYFPYRQVSMSAMSVVMKVEGDLDATAGEARAAVGALDPGLAASDIQPLGTLVDRALARDRFVTGLLTAFALAALLLAAVGIYGVVSYGVARRMREMGIRKALGANGSDVQSLVVRGAAGLAGLGILLGGAGAVALGRLLGSLLFEVEATDPVTFALTALLLGAVALGAAWIPAWRARAADPMAVLRDE
ncbi:MAG: hypothetical protein AMXMBFR53_38320 [Gemmatimonadota bacterium]